MVNTIEDGRIYKFVNALAGNVAENTEDDESVVGYDWHGGDTQKV